MAWLDFRYSSPVLEGRKESLPVNPNAGNPTNCFDFLFKLTISFRSELLAMIAKNGRLLECSFTLQNSTRVCHRES